MAFELPAALSLRIVHPPFVYGTAVVTFGVCAVCMSAARTYAAVMVLRLLIGLAEAFVQTGFVFISLWYTKDELTTRCGMLSFDGRDKTTKADEITKLSTMA
jgi:MFS family permease